MESDAKTVPVAEGAADKPADPLRGAAAQPISARLVIRLAAIFAIALVVCLTVYLAFAVPGRWFSNAPPLAWGPSALQIANGTARVVGDELQVMPADASGVVVVSVRTTLKATDYAAVEWIAIDVPESIDVSLLWRTNYKPAQLNSIPLNVVAGRLLPAMTRNHPAWVGDIEGLALAMRGPIAEPVRIRGVVVKRLSAGEVLRDRMGEWLAFEAWTGTSINTLTGGADLQDLPLPLLLAAAVGVAMLIVVALNRWRRSLVPFPALALFVLALGAWLLLDLRWMWNLARQVDATADRFAGKSFVDKRLAVEDGPLFAFIQKAKEVMPPTPVRVIVVADSHYFRGRAAYHLYPHSPFFDPRANTIPEPSQVRPGDWLLVYQRKGVQFDAAQGKLRWDNRSPVSAELKLAGRGAALFLVH
jgi:hypothetical protein